MSVSMKFSGGRDMEKALAKLAAGTAKGVQRRAMKKVLKPVAEQAGASPFEVEVTSKLTRREAGGVRADRARDVVTMYVGPVDNGGKGAPHAQLIEFGTVMRHHASGKAVGAVMADPFMRPAWDAHAPNMLEELGRLTWSEIEKTLARNARRAAR
ncbi:MULTISPECIES: hypothetical protein [unclassified Sulfitobacter]|uniref:hypothetical protein n=1 Tax=unclassified Sulfitobacter TaxID=196795 RepID=UPI0007C2658A|nr:MULTISPECIES: hypothetical protein [unclassified Sulfitobacter]KZX90394.1 hypothetical protein A3720_10435 [Sulfitobacter sp. HI0021]KZY04220.1 hypothetical protein A3722_19535 [Sulfitobacter sp. HI0027]KZZ01833.1 hypothetical protein A3747_17885 [Sulfitobacter sp. HI0076]